MGPLHTKWERQRCVLFGQRWVGESEKTGMMRRAARARDRRARGSCVRERKSRARAVRVRARAIASSPERAIINTLHQEGRIALSSRGGCGHKRKWLVLCSCSCASPSGAILLKLWCIMRCTVELFPFLRRE